VGGPVILVACDRGETCHPGLAWTAFRHALLERHSRDYCINIADPYTGSQANYHLS
jgi:hypothetical protein